MPDYYPLPDSSPYEDFPPYRAILIGLVDDYLTDPDQWAEDDYPEALTLMEELKAYLAEIETILGVPITTVLEWWGNTLPAGYLYCDGALYNRDDYPLFVANCHPSLLRANNLFAVPDHRNRFPVGWNGNVIGDNTGNVGGAATHTLTLAESPAHSHAMTGSTILAKQNGTPGTSNRLLRGTDANTNSSVVNQLAITLDTQGGGGAHNNLPPYQTARFIVKVL